MSKRVKSGLEKVSKRASSLTRGCAAAAASNGLRNSEAQVCSTGPPMSWESGKWGAPSPQELPEVG